MHAVCRDSRRSHSAAEGESTDEADAASECREAAVRVTYTYSDMRALSGPFEAEHNLLGLAAVVANG